MRFLGAVILFAAVGLSEAQAQVPPSDKPTPLFTAFQKFCVRTKAEPQAIQASVLDGGGTLAYKSKDKGNTPIEHSSTKTWTVAVDGAAIRVSSVTYNLPSVPPNIVCAVSIHGYDPASVAAVRNWVEVAPTRSSDHSWSYNYIEISPNRTRVPSGAPEGLLDSGRRVNWELNVQEHNGTEFELTRSPPPVPTTLSMAGITAPQPRGPAHNCADQYPRNDRKGHAVGKPILRFRIMRDGHVENVAVVMTSGSVDLDNAAVACVKTWQYVPATHKGAAMEMDWKAEVD